MTEPLVLREGLFHCVIGDEIVILDVDSDRYSMMRGLSAQRFLRFVNKMCDAGDVEWLQSNGMVMRASQRLGLPPSVIPPEPKQSLVEGMLPSPSLGMIARVGAYQIAATRALRRRRLADVLQQMQRLRLQTMFRSSASNPALCRIVAAHRDVQMYLPSIDQCLPRGIALTKILFRAGISATLVIGVTLPFAAHCWVQVGDDLVSDPIDRVRPFTPIFAL